MPVRDRTYEGKGVAVTVRWDYGTPEGYRPMSLVDRFHCEQYRAEITLRANTGFKFNDAKDFKYGASKVSHDAVGGQSGTESRSVTVWYEEVIGFFASDTANAPSALKRIRDARDEYTSAAAPLYVDLSLGGPEDVSLTPGSLEITGAVLDSSNSPAHVRIDGRGRNIQLGGTPSGNAVITVKSGVTLYLRNITLTGLTDPAGLSGPGNNTAPLITVDGGTLILEDAAVVQGNTNTSRIPTAESNAANNAGGIGVKSGTLRMEGGEVSGNTGYHCGGVYSWSGTFNMKGGKISGNTARQGGGVRNGGGFSEAIGTFIMEGGEISGNTATFTTTANGAGVRNTLHSIFTMKGGKISGNTSEYDGGGVYNTGRFTMQGGEISRNYAKSGDAGGVFNWEANFIMEAGEISGNTASKNGGGVYNCSGSVEPAEFTMQGGKISGNTAYENGGGVYISRSNIIGAGIFSMQGGEISGNTASAYGGGVFVYYYGIKDGSASGTFIKTGGTIYGDTDTDHTPGSTENTAASGGHAVYLARNYASPHKKRDNDVGTGTEGNLYFSHSYSSGSWTFTDGTIPAGNWDL
jgi:hypothetical protein